MLEFTLGTIFGFVAGCSLKDFILSKLDKCKRFQIPQSLIKIEKTSLNHNGESQTTADVNNNGFNLCSIQSVFDKYEVKLMGVNSFIILLNKIERVAYKETLKQFNTSVRNPEELFALIEQGNTYNEIVKPQYSRNSILLSESNINEMLNKNCIIYSNETSIPEKIQTLVSFHVSKGLSQFQKTMGPSLGQFIADYKEKKDVSLLFDGIKANINRALNLLS